MKRHYIEIYYTFRFQVSSFIGIRVLTLIKKSRTQKKGGKTMSKFKNFKCGSQNCTSHDGSTFIYFILLQIVVLLKAFNIRSDFHFFGLETYRWHITWPIAPRICTNIVVHPSFEFPVYLFSVSSIKKSDFQTSRKSFPPQKKTHRIEFVGMKGYYHQIQNQLILGKIFCRTLKSLFC